MKGFMRDFDDERKNGSSSYSCVTGVSAVVPSFILLVSHETREWVFNETEKMTSEGDTEKMLMEWNEGDKQTKLQDDYDLDLE